MGFSATPDLFQKIKKINHRQKKEKKKKGQKSKQQMQKIAFYDYRAPLGNQIFTDENVAWHYAAVAVW